jgi:hypothetical protein
MTLTSCAMTFDATELGVPTSMAESAQTPVAADAKTFRVTKHPVFMFWGLVGVSRPNLEDVLAGQVGTGSRITNLRITVRSRLSDLFVTALTLGAITPRSVTFEGAIIPATTSSNVGP